MTPETKAACFVSIQKVSLVLWDGSSSHKRIPGIFAVTDNNEGEKSCEHDKADERQLVLLVTDGKNSSPFRTCITADTVKSVTQVPSSLDPIDYLCSLLLPTQPQQQEADADTQPSSLPPEIKFEILETDELRLEVVQRLSSGLVKKPWSQTFSRDGSTTNLPFMLDLVNDRDAVLSRVKALEEKLSCARQDSEEWKNTAEQLEGTWEKEKKELLQNMFELYSKKQEQAANKEKEVTKLKRELEEKNKALKEAAKRPGGQRYAIPDFLANLPDDHDEELYDSDTVNRMVGKGGRKKAATKRVAPEKVPSAASLPKKRRNEITGSIEHFDADALVQDRSLFPLPDEDGASDDRPEKKSGVASKPRPRKHPLPEKKKAKPEPVRNNSDTDSDDSLVDKDLKDDIMSQLAALKEAEG